MQWKLNRAQGTAVDPYGVGDLLSRLESDVFGAGEKLSGFRFLNSAREMMRYTREIENEAAQSTGGAQLYVGFQNSEKAEAEVSRYSRLSSSGVVPIPFGEGDLSDDALKTFPNWCQLRPNHELLENQFLITERPSPIAFIGWEVSDEEDWGKRGATETDKEFAGFVTDDPRVVAELICYLEEIRTREQGESVVDRSLLDFVQQEQVQRLLVVIDDGRQPHFQRVLDKATRLGRVITGSRLFLYDLAVASYLVDPYPSPDESWRRPLASGDLQALGRQRLAELVQRSSSLGVSTYAILPDHVGFDHLGEWCASQGIDAVILPAELTQPSLLERLKGRTIERLKSSSNVRIVIEDPVRGPSLG